MPTELTLFGISLRILGLRPKALLRYPSDWRDLHQTPIAKNSGPMVATWIFREMMIPSSNLFLSRPVRHKQFRLGSAGIRCIVVCFAGARQFTLLLVLKRSESSPHNHKPDHTSHFRQQVENSQRLTVRDALVSNRILRLCRDDCVPVRWDFPLIACTIFSAWEILEGGRYGSQRLSWQLSAVVLRNGSHVLGSLRKRMLARMYSINHLNASSSLLILREDMGISKRNSERKDHRKFSSIVYPEVPPPRSQNEEKCSANINSKWKAWDKRGKHMIICSRTQTFVLIDDFILPGIRIYPEIDEESFVVLSHHYLKKMFFDLNPSFSRVDPEKPPLKKVNERRLWLLVLCR
jgi:hypothetical protein